MGGHRTYVTNSTRAPAHAIRPVSDMRMARGRGGETDHRSIPRPVASELALRSSQT